MGLFRSLKVGSHRDDGMYLGSIRATLSPQQLSSGEVTRVSSLKQKKGRGLAITVPFQATRLGKMEHSLSVSRFEAPDPAAHTREALTGTSVMAPGRACWNTASNSDHSWGVGISDRFPGGAAPAGLDPH